MSGGNNPVVQERDEWRAEQFNRLRANLEDAIRTVDTLRLAGEITDGEWSRLDDKLESAKNLSDQLFDSDRPIRV